jgi:hypothetical protein
MVQRKPHKSYFGETGPLNIKASKRSFNWKRYRGKRGGEHTTLGLVSIKHHEYGRRGGKQFKTYALYLRASLQTVFGTFRYAVIYYYDNYVGLKFYENKSDTSYTLGLSSKKRFRLQAKIFEKFEQRDYEAEDLEFDTFNKMLVIPVKLIEGAVVSEEDFRFSEFDSVKVNKTMVIK